jgi:hypothetical protein
MSIYKAWLNKLFIYPLGIILVSISAYTFSGSATYSWQRLAPPTGLPCSRDELTSFAGQVRAYTRKPEQIFLRVRTDEATTESFTIPIERKESLLQLYLLNGTAIKQSQLEIIEKKLVKKPAEVRVIVWACRNSADRIIDWRVELN